MIRILRIATVAYCAVVAWLLLTPNPLGWLGWRIPSLPGADRMGHFALFAILSGLVWASHWPLRWQWLLVPMFLYAGATELFQAFVPQRTLDAGDLAANLAGVLAGTLCWWAAVTACVMIRKVDCSASKPTEATG